MFMPPVFYQVSANDRANADVVWATPGSSVTVAFRCPAVSMVIVVSHSSVIVVLVGMVFSVPNVCKFATSTRLLSILMLTWGCDVVVVATCRRGCHNTRGYCESPGECRCRLGWAGRNCSECAVLPGCQYGTCSKPLECHCMAGYTGLLCTTRKFSAYL